MYSLSLLFFARFKELQQRAHAFPAFLSFSESMSTCLPQSSAKAARLQAGCNRLRIGRELAKPPAGIGRTPGYLANML